MMTSKYNFFSSAREGTTTGDSVCGGNRTCSVCDVIIAKEDGVNEANQKIATKNPCGNCKKNTYSSATNDDGVDADEFITGVAWWF